MYSSCDTKWWIAWAWIWRHETTSKRKLAYEWPTAHMSKNLIHNFVSFLFLYFAAWEFFFPLHSIYLRNFWKESKNRLFLQFLMNFYFVARLPIKPRRHILVYEKRESNPYGHSCPKDFLTTLAFIQANLTLKSLWSGTFQHHIGNVAQLKPHSYFVHRMP